MLFGEQRYLVAYHLLPASHSDYFNGQEYLINKWRQRGERITPQFLKDTLLALSLLSFAPDRDFYEIKQFNPSTDITVAPTKTVLDRQESLTNLKQIALALFMYVQDYNETLPPMVAARSADEIKDFYKIPGIPYSSDLPPPPPPEYPRERSMKITATTSIQNRLMPYVRNKMLFLQPATHRPYLPNYKISRLSDAEIDNPATTFLFYEDAPDAGGMRCVAYADGHAKALSEAEFQRERKAQGISESGYPSAAKPAQKAKATPKA
jgi:hypothetical protein